MLAATLVTLGQAVGVVVVAELLSAIDGVGAEVSLACTNLVPAVLFAWTVALIVLASSSRRSCCADAPHP